MLDAEDNDVFGGRIDGVINKVGIFPRDELRTPRTVCRRPMSGNRIRVCKESMMAARTRNEAAGLRSRI